MILSYNKKIHTLVGKNKYLFLINDENKEIECHQNNIIMTDNINHHSDMLDKFAMLIYPDKSFVCQVFLPDEYQPLLYRPAYHKFYNYLTKNLFDGLLYVTPEDYYKTDTHLNINGVYKIYSKFINYVNNLLNINLNVIEINIICEDNYTKFENLAYGDLKKFNNAGDLDLSDYYDKLYYTDTYPIFYPLHVISTDDQYKYLAINKQQLIDKTSVLIDTVVNWSFIGNYIIYKQNTNLSDKKVLVFYDSFSLFIIPIILQLSNEVYIFKHHFSKEIINIIQPDIILELRIERFLN